MAAVILTEKIKNGDINTEKFDLIAQTNEKKSMMLK